MGFFFQESASRTNAPARRVIPIELLKKGGCNACPLSALERKIKSPKMAPTGSQEPVVYWLGDWPSEADADKGRQFAGQSSRSFFRPVPDHVWKLSRFSNAVRCRHPNNDKPTDVIKSCCGSLTERDIEETKPVVVVGLGEEPLQWATGLSNVHTWRGTVFPIKVGTHACWFYSILHPAFVEAKRGKYGSSEFDVTQDIDLQRFLDWLSTSKQVSSVPPVVTEGFFEGVQSIEGQQAGDIDRVERAVLALVNDPSGIAFDIETDGLRPFSSQHGWLTAAISNGVQTVAFPVRHPMGWSRPRDIARVVDLVRHALTESHRVIAHNAAMEQEWMVYEYGKLLPYLVRWEDTMALAHTIDARPKTMGLGAQTMIAFGFDLKSKSPVDAKRIMQYPLAHVLPYNGGDALWTHRLFHAREHELNSYKAARHEYERKLRTIPTTVQAQVVGIPVSQAAASRLEREFEERLVDGRRKLSKCLEVMKYEDRFNKRFDAGNDEDVRRLLNDVMNLGVPSVGAEVLTEIDKSEGLSPGIIIEMRQAEKVLSTYVRPVISKQIVHVDGRMHPNYSLMYVASGRTSSEDPNGQNWPKRKNRNVRAVVQDETGECIIVAIDYGQIEARVIAMASEDDNLVKAQWTDFDIHGVWYRRFVEGYPEFNEFLARQFSLDVNDEKALFKVGRQEAKNKWVFPQFFGSSSYSCAHDLNLPESFAKELAGEFWDTYPRVKKWQKRLITKWEKELYVETLTGRRRRGPMTPNEIINHPVQGTAADIVLDAWNRLTEYGIATDQYEYIAPLNVHDDLTSFVPAARVDPYIETAARFMCDSRFAFINVPLVVEVSTGKSWDALEEVKKYRSDEFGFHHKGQSR